MKVKNLSIKYELENNYNKYRYEQKRLQEQLKQVENDFMPTITPSYSGMPSGKGSTSDSTFNAVNKIIITKEKLKTMIKAYDEHCSVMLALLDTLPQAYADIVKYRCFIGLPFAEIGKEMNLEECCVKKRYYKALNDMQQIYDEQKHFEIED